MATVTLGSTPTTIDLAEGTGSWGGDTFTLEPDIKVQGSNSVACAQTVNGNNDAYVTGTWDFSGTGLGDQHLRLWFNISYIGNLATSNAIQVYLYDGTNTAYYYWDKWADYSGGWAQAVIYTGDSPDSGSVTKSSVTRIGMRFVTITKPRNVPANAWFDAWRYGDGYYATGGTSGDEIDLDLIAVDDLTNAYGIVTKETNGSISLRGDLQIGNGATTTWFKMDNEEAFFVEEQVNTGLYKVHGNGAGCRIDIADSAFKAAGTAAKDAFDFDMSETNLLTMSMVDTKLTRADAVTFKSSQTATGNIFSGCGQITHAGADMDDIVVKGYEGTADTSALIYNVAADPDGELDNSSFEKGTALTHAIEFGLTSPTSITLRGIDFSGYNVADTNTDSTFHVLRTGGTVTINVVDCTGNLTYKSAGATVVIAQTVDIEITGVTEGARVAIHKTSDNTELLNTLAFTSDGAGAYKGTASYDYGAGPDVPVRVGAASSGKVVAGVSADTAVFTDETTQANNSATGASDTMTLLPTTSPATPDAFYYGHTEQYIELDLDILTAGAGTYTLAWEYWDGDSWEALTGLTDDTNNYKNAGINRVSWTLPGDWAATSVTNQPGPSDLYYIRARFVSGTVTTTPVGRTALLNVTKYLRWEATNTITSTGLSVKAAWRVDDAAIF